MIWLFPRPSMRMPTEKDDVVQVKYTNPDTVLHGSVSCVIREDYTLSGRMSARREKLSMTFASEKRPPLVTSWGGRVRRKSVFFWIKSSAKRAFGECLGSKRR
jgi:hypothetical protein